ncbi:MAG: hypothetical protein R2813_11420 [Flavobacteriales bacterium]
MKAKRLKTYQAHSGSLYALAEGRTNGTFFSGGADKVVAEWSLAKAEPNEFAIRTDHTIYSLLNLHSQTLLIGTIVGGIHVIDLVEKREVRHLKLHDKGIFYFVSLREKQQVIACSADGSISVWNTLDWSLERHIRLSHEKIRRAAFNAEISVAAIACGDGTIQLLRTDHWEVTESIKAHEDGANSVAFLPDGTLLSGGKDALLKQWDPTSMVLLQAIPAHNFAIYDIVRLGDSELIATVSRDKTVKLWHPQDMQNPLRLDRKTHQAHLNSVNAGLWLETEQILLTCGDDRTIIAWAVEA